MSGSYEKAGVSTPRIFRRPFKDKLRVSNMDKCYFICFISVNEPLTVIEQLCSGSFQAIMKKDE
ncbi:hypothetical protein SFRURICE_002519 [Spodoptera frugiperda]|nr:hypothetical protein SFRURICE_002519 [Spodoptera frugiperda]